MKSTFVENTKILDPEEGRKVREMTAFWLMEISLRGESPDFALTYTSFKLV